MLTASQRVGCAAHSDVGAPMSGMPSALERYVGSGAL